MIKKFLDYMRLDLENEEEYDDIILERKSILTSIFGKQETDIEPQQGNILIRKPRDVEEIKGIIDHLLKKNVVMVNLEEVEHSIKRRMIDMLTGYCYTQDQMLRKVNENIYIVSE